MDYRTDRSRVTGLGSAHEGVSHWWGQRVTAIALAVLGLFVIWPLGASIGADRAEVVAAFSRPWTAILTILFIIVAFRHLQLGLQVVVEDYVHNKATRTALLLANTFFCALFGLAGVFGVAKMAFGG